MPDCVHVAACPFRDGCPEGCRATPVAAAPEEPRGTAPALHAMTLETVSKEPETVLEEAQRLVYGERAAAYGNAREEAEKVAVGWSVITGSEIRPEHYPLCMAWLKIVRQTNRAKRDNLTDLAGYAGVAEKIERG